MANITPINKISDWRNWVIPFAEVRDDRKVYIGFYPLRERFIEIDKTDPKEVPNLINSALTEQAFRYSNAYSTYSIKLYDKEISPPTIEVIEKSKLAAVRNINGNLKIPQPK